MEQKLTSPDKEVLVRLDNFPKAAQFVNAVLSQKYRVVCYGGAIRGGKSFNAIAALILLHRLYPGSRSMIVRENLDVLRKNMLPTCEKAIPSNFVRHYKGDPQFEWTFTNGSKMFFFSEGYEKDKEYLRWNGLEVNFILLEQVEELQLKALEKSLERVGSYIIPNAKQPEPQILMTINPTKTWAKELIYDKWTTGTLPEKWLYIPALISDNPNIPQSFKDSLQELKRINPVKYARYVEGDWEVQDVVEGAFWKSFSYELHVKELKIDLDLPLHISFDENVNPYPALSIWQIDGKDARQLHEICLRHPENKLIKVAKEFVRWVRSQSWNNLVYIYGDATSQKEDAKLQAGYNYFTMLRNEIEPHFRCQIRKPSRNPPVAMSADFINSILELNYDDIKITIHEGCTESIKDYTTVQEAADGTMIKKKTNGVELLGHCFVEDTLIITSEGEKKIKDVKTGDQVLTRKGYKKVLRSGLTRKNALVKTYNICGNEITCTSDHKVFTLNRGFIEVSKLIITDTFHTLQNGNANGFYLNSSDQVADVYDLTVEDQPEFYANNVLVHNCSDNFRYLIAEVFKDSFRKYQRGTSVTDYSIAPSKRRSY